LTKSPIVIVEAYEVPPPPKKATRLSIDVDPTSAPVPAEFHISGNLTDVELGIGIDGKPIRIYENGVFIETVYTRTPVVSPVPLGYYEYTRRILTPGTYEFQAEFPGDEEYEGCEDRVFVW